MANKFFDFDRARSQFQNQFKGVKQFSGETALLLSLFSWLVYLLIQDPEIRKFISFLGWLFLIVGTDWVLFERQWDIPVLQVKVKFGPWITGALLSLALVTNGFIDDRTGFVLYPIFSAIISTFPRFLKPGPEIRRLKEYSDLGRQEVVLSILIGLLLSSWFQFHFVLQDLLAQYPSILSDSFGRSNFVVALNPPPTIPQGVEILQTAERLILDRLRSESWRDGQRFLRDMDTSASPVNPDVLEPEIFQQIFANSPAAQEQRLWNYSSSFSADPLEGPSGLRAVWYGTVSLTATWRGPSSENTGYVLERLCRIPREPPVQQVRGLERPRDLNLSLLECQPIRSSNPDIQVERRVETPPDPGQNQGWNIFRFFRENPLFRENSQP